MTAAEFTTTILGEIERAFYPGTKMRFLQDRTELLEAILLPNRYLNERIATGTQYAAIVRKVIATIRAHGTPDPRRRFSLYFLKCMQGTSITTARNTSRTPKPSAPSPARKPAPSAR